MPTARPGGQTRPLATRPHVTHLAVTRPAVTNPSPAARRGRATAPGHVALAAAILTGWALPALAQDGDEGVVLDTVTLQAGAAGAGLHWPSTAGSRLGLSAFETPASVTVIDGRTIREEGERNVTQALAWNGVGITAHPTPGNAGTLVSMRGFSGNNSIIKLYDGTRIYPASTTVSFPFDTWSVERIEILGGPAGVLFGEGGVGGAINVIPRKPRTDHREDEARLTLGTKGETGLAYASAGPLGERLAYSIAANVTGTDGWMDRDNASTRSLSAALRWQATDDLAVTLSHDFGDNRPSRYFGTPLVDGKLDKRVRYRNYNVSDSMIRYKDRYTQLRAEWSPSDAVKVQSNFYYMTSDRDWRNVEAYAYDMASGQVARGDYIALNHDLKEYGNRTFATIETTPWGLSNRLNIGFEVGRMRFRHTNNSPYQCSTEGGFVCDPFVNFLNPQPGMFGPATMKTAVDITDNHYALFLDDRLALNDQLSFVGGLRFDHHRVHRVDPAFDKTIASTSWRVGTVWNPRPDVALYAQYSRTGEPIGSILTMSEAQSELKLTRARQQEVGVKLDLPEGRGEVTLAAYRIVKNDLQARDPLDPTVIRQIGQQSSKGVEASFSYEITPALRVAGNLAMLSPRYDDYVQSGGDYSGNRPSNIPRRVANLHAEWDFADGWTARASAHHVGTVFTDDANTTTRPSYTILNAGLQWRARDNMSLDLNIDNLTNRLYAPSGNVRQWRLAPPRMARLDLNIRF